MHPFKTIAQRLFVAASLVLVTACGSNGITEPSAKNSGYLTVSASGYNVPAKPVRSAVSPSAYNVPAKPVTVSLSGYNVTARAPLVKAP